MKINFDLHTHTVYSHGKGTIAENAATAKEKGLYGIGITDHGFSHPAFGMRRKKLGQMRADCTAAEKEYGVCVFGESFSLQLAIGILAILAGVTIIIARKKG